jgi:hypothetical protein
MANLRFLAGGNVAPMRESGLGMFGEIASRFLHADISLLNLEGAQSEKGEAVPGKTYCFRGTPASVDRLAEARLLCVNIANNHVLDYGDGALLDTIDRLDQKAIVRTAEGPHTMGPLEDRSPGSGADRNGREDDDSAAFRAWLCRICCGGGVTGLRHAFISDGEKACQKP